MFATFVRDQHPLIEVRFTENRETPQSFKAYLQGLEENYEKNEPISIVFDAREAFPLNPKYQLKQALWMKEKDALIRQYCVGVAYVIPNTLLRQILQLFFKLQPSPTAFKVFKDIPEARQWAQDRLDGKE
jgi:hypothetical protein